MAQLNQLTQDTIAEITAKATTDAAFRQALLQNPEQTLKEHGYTQVQNKRVRFVDRSAEADLVVVLPEFATADAELDADQLEAVAGGDIGCTICGDVGKTFIACTKTCLGTFSDDGGDGGI